METTRQGGELLIGLVGEFDLFAFDEVDQLLADSQSEEDLRVVVDLRALEFIDSTGMRALVRAHARAEAAGGQLRLIRGPATVQRVFELAGLDGRLPFVDAP